MEQFKGYVKHKNKKICEKFNKGVGRTFEEIKENPDDYAGLLKEGYVVIDCDDDFSQELVQHIIHIYELNTIETVTSKGSHFYFKAKGMRNKTHTPIALGCYVDIKSGDYNGTSIIKIGGQMREMITHGDGSISNLPPVLQPLKKSEKLTELFDDLETLEVGSRNSTLFKLASRLFTTTKLKNDDVFNVVQLHNYMLTDSLSNDEVETIVKSAKDAQNEGKIETLEALENKGIGDILWLDVSDKGKIKINKVKLIDNLIQEPNFLSKDKVDNLYIYNRHTQIYQISDKSKLSGAILDYLQEKLKDTLAEILGDKSISGLLNDLSETILNISGHKFHQIETNGSHMIYFKDVWYNLLTDEYGEYTDDMCVTNKLEVSFLCDDYNPNHDSVKRLKQFIKEITIGKDQKEKAKSLKQLCALACMNEAHLYETAYLLIGSGANGKSTFTTLLSKYIVGVENTSYLNLKQLEEKFMINELFNKKLNISDDLNDTVIKDSSQLKSIISGQSISVDVKYSKAQNLVNKAVLVFNANHTPRFLNFTGALTRRFKFISFDNTFDHSKKDHRLLEKITTEHALHHLVLSIIEEAKNIYHNGLDEYNDDEKVQQIKLENNNVYAFVQFLEEQGLDGFFDGETYDVSQTYGKYKEFIKQENYRNALPKVVFGRELRKEGIISVIKKTDGRSVRYYVRKDYTE